VVLGVLDALDAGASIKLCSEEFVGLHKSVEFVGQVGVLGLQDLSMSLESFLLIQVIFLLSLALMVHSALAVNISLRHEECFLKTLQVHLRISDFMA
jgi:hypothetical protein